jgi:hypothetical protein
LSLFPLGPFLAKRNCIAPLREKKIKGMGYKKQRNGRERLRFLEFLRMRKRKALV